MSQAADFTEDQDGAGRRIRLSGDLTVAQLGDLPQRLGDTHPDKVDLGDVGRMDTIGAWIVHRMVAGDTSRIDGARPEYQKLIDGVGEADQHVEMRPERTSSFIRVLDEIGDAVVVAGRTLAGLLAFFGAMLVSAGHLARHPGRFRWNAVVTRFETVGVAALGIIGLMSFLIGIVIAQQGAVQLRQFGAEVFTINLVGRLTIRELGPLMTAIMVAGRSGSAFAAQLGTMKLTEEIDAMRTIGVSPMEALVLPRVLAAVILMPLLSFYSMVIGIIGGGFLAWASLGIPPYTFIQRIQEVVPLTDLWVGLLKAPVFGAIIALSGCFQGMQVEGNAEEVGLRTTSAVVQGIFLVIVLDAFFAVAFTWIGWI